MHFDNRIEVVATLDSPQLIRMANTVGRILPPHASSLGKAITAHLPDDVVERLRRSYGNASVHRAHHHRRGRAQAGIRARPHPRATRSMPRRACSRAAASARRSPPPTDVVIAALSLSLPKMRLRDKAMQKQIIAAVRDAAAQTGRALRTLAREA